VAAQAASLQATKFNERLKPYILGLRKHVAKIPLAEACKLRSGHAISFYLYCWSWYTSHERGWSMRVEQLFDFLRTPKQVHEKVAHQEARINDWGGVLVGVYKPSDPRSYFLPLVGLAAFFPGQRVGKHWAIISADSYGCWTAKGFVARRGGELDWRILVIRRSIQR
jgi:hypothetical protein